MLLRYYGGPRRDVVVRVGNGVSCVWQVTRRRKKGKADGYSVQLGSDCGSKSSGRATMHLRYVINRR